MNEKELQKIVGENSSNFEIIIENKSFAVNDIKIFQTETIHLGIPISAIFASFLLYILNVIIYERLGKNATSTLWEVTG